MSERLAVDGGPRSITGPLPKWPSFDDQTIQAVVEPLKSGRVNYWTGEMGMKFERRFAAWNGSRFAISTTNGTSALHTALAGLGIGPGDEVIVPSYTFIASSFSIVQAGAIPRFADVNREDHCISVESAAQLITERTKAIMPVHLYGNVTDMGPLLALAEKHGLVVIEDNAEAYGGAYKGRKTGSIGNAGCVSFCQNKTFTTGGEGGMVTTNDDDFAEIGRSFKDHGYWEEEHKDLLQMEALYPYIHHRVGFNYRMTEMQSVIGMVCLRRLDEWVDKRRENAHFLSECIGRIAQLEPPHEAPHVKHAFYKYAFTIKPETLKCSRDDFILALRAEGIPCIAGVPPSNQMEEVFQKHVGYGHTKCPFACPWYGDPPDYSKMKTPVAERIGARTVWLLVHPTVERKDLKDAATALEKVAGAYAV